MPRLDQQDEVLRELAVIETLPVDDLADGIVVRPTHDDGFSVGIRRLASGTAPSGKHYRVECGPGPWECFFAAEDEALDLFFTCLTEDARMTVTLRGATVISWDLELRSSKDPNAWTSLGTCRRLLVPWWCRPVRHHLANPFLRPPENPLGSPNQP